MDRGGEDSSGLRANFDVICGDHRHHTIVPAPAMFKTYIWEGPHMGKSGGGGGVVWSGDMERGL